MTTTENTKVDGLSVPAAQRAGSTVITKRFEFESAHFLPHVPEDHKCRRMHGHSYEVIVHVSGPMDEEAGWIVDFGEIKGVWKPLEQRLDHRLLNDIPGLENPTAENLAAWIWAEYEEQRRIGAVSFRVAAVEVAETKDSKAMFVAPDVKPWVPGSRAVSLPTPVSTPPASPAPRRPVAEYELDADGLPDVQDQPDTRGIALDEVGVSDIRVPIAVMDRDNSSQRTVAVVSMGVNVPAHKKGTHLSRFVRGLRDHGDELSLFSLAALARELRSTLDGDRVRIRVEFPYFLERAAPVSGEVGSLDVDCAFEVIDSDGAVEHWLEVTTPITTVCPCSRDISDYGAHNQRGRITCRVLCDVDEAGMPALIWIEDIVDIAEASGSAPVHSVIRRSDERHVTMAAYDNPKFVEDVARDVVLKDGTDAIGNRTRVKVVNDESIHAHDAFAFSSGGTSQT